MRNLKQSTATNVMVFMTASADHVTGLAGAALTVTASKDGEAFAGIAPTVTDRGNGWYNLALTALHTDTLGDLALHVTATSADPSDLLCRVVAGSLDADVSTRLAAASYTAPANSDITAIKAKTDTLVNTDLTGIATSVELSGLSTFNAATDTVLADVKQMNGATVLGNGTAANLWRGE